MCICFLNVTDLLKISRRILNDQEIINELDEIFSLLDDPDVSGDNLESHEDEVPFSSAKLQRFSKNFNKPSDGPLTPIPIPSDSPTP